MKRRDFVGGMALAAGLTACAGDERSAGVQTTASAETFEWNIVTSWPPGLPGLGQGVERFVERIEAASAGRLKIKIFAGGELVPALEVYDAERSGRCPDALVIPCREEYCPVRIDARLGEQSGVA